MEIWCVMTLKNRDWDYMEKVNLASDPNTPVAVLRELARDKEGMIRRYVARNTTIPEDVLLELVMDISRSIRWYVTRNPKVSSNVLIKLFEHEKSLKKPCRDVITALYAHKKLPHVAKAIIETLFGEMLN